MSTEAARTPSGDPGVTKNGIASFRCHCEIRYMPRQCPGNDPLLPLAQWLARARRILSTSSRTPDRVVYRNTSRVNVYKDLSFSPSLCESMAHRIACTHFQFNSPRGFGSSPNSKAICSSSGVMLATTYCAGQSPALRVETSHIIGLIRRESAPSPPLAEMPSLPSARNAHQSHIRRAYTPDQILSALSQVAIWAVSGVRRDPLEPTVEPTKNRWSNDPDPAV